MVTKAWHGREFMASGAGGQLITFYLNRGRRVNEQEIGQPLVMDFVQQGSTPEGSTASSNNAPKWGPST